jgi:ElaB/YqjD/DUF883 family membrane-anchored ribosome-binding protein
MTDPDRKTATIKDTYELAEQLEEIKANMANLSSTVGRIANKRIGDEAIKENPLLAMAIAVGLGFLVGIFARR